MNHLEICVYCPSLCFQTIPSPCPCAWGVRSHQIFHPQRRDSCHTSSSSHHHLFFSHSLYPVVCLLLCLFCGQYHDFLDGRVTCPPLWTRFCPSLTASQVSLVLISCHPLVCLACLPSFSWTPDNSPVCAAPSWAAFLAYHLSCPPLSTSRPGPDNPQGRDAAAGRPLGGSRLPASSVGEFHFCFGFYISMCPALLFFSRWL